MDLIGAREEDRKRQPWELGEKYDGNFIFTFAVVKVRYGGITMVKIWRMKKLAIIGC